MPGNQLAPALLIIAVLIGMTSPVEATPEARDVVVKNGVAIRCMASGSGEAIVFVATNSEPRSRHCEARCSYTGEHGHTGTLEVSGSVAANASHENMAMVHAGLSVSLCAGQVKAHRQFER